VDELDAWPEEHAPAGRPRAVAEVDLLVEHEEACVEAADLIEKLSADEQDRSDEELRFTT
jgi:hypothetical protein